MATSGQDLKALGNSAFQAGNFEEAEDLYSQAIAAAGDAASAVLYGNRSATRLALGRPEDALADAEAAIAKDEKWLKGWHRKACAYKAMSKLDAVYEAYHRAASLEPQNKWLLEQLRSASRELQREAREMAVPSKEYLLTVFTSLVDVRERLSLLAYFWNACTEAQRYAVFRRFLEIMAGTGSAHTGISGADFTEDLMQPLPLDNYTDLPPVATWMNFLQALSPEEKLAMFEALWGKTTAKERDIISNDMKTFFYQPMIEKRFGNPDDRDSEDEEDGTAQSAGNAGNGTAAALVQPAPTTTSTGSSVNDTGSAFIEELPDDTQERPS